jgi:hypothetical protein
LSGEGRADALEYFTTFDSKEFESKERDDHVYFRHHVPDSALAGWLAGEL